MKFFAVFAAVVAVACATPASWSLHQLSQALENPTTSAVLRPVLENALDIYMEGVYHGHYQGSIQIKTAAGSAGKYTIAQLDAALQKDVVKSSILKTYFEDALDKIMSALFAGEQMESVDVHVPALQLSYWTLSEIDAALSDSTTEHAFIPYLKDALDTIMADLFNGGKQNAIVIAVPAAIFDNQAVEASPIAISPIVENPVAPVATISDSPLVQIIVNVQQAAEDLPAFENPKPTMPMPTLPEVDPSEVFENPKPTTPKPTIPEPTLPEVAPVNPIDVLPVEHLPPSPEIIVGPMM